jgi:phosphomannomutase
MKELKEIELIKKVYEDKGRPNNEVQAFALSCLIEYKKQLLLHNVSQQRKLLEFFIKTQASELFKTETGFKWRKDMIEETIKNFNCG